MSTMAVLSGAAARSRLNPNAPLYIPAAFQQVEDFSPEWWELVKTTTWFQDYWLQQHEEQETFDGDDDDDFANLLLDYIDLVLGDELGLLEAEFEAPAYHQTMGAEGLASGILKKEQLMPGWEWMHLHMANEAKAAIGSLILKPPKNDRVRPVVESAKYREKPLPCVSPKCSPRRIIHQPR